MATHCDDIQAIRHLLDRYFQAIGKADIETLRTIFTPDAAVYGCLGDDALAGTPEQFLAQLAGRPSMVEQNIDCTYVVKSIQAAGRIASAVIQADNFYGETGLEDHLHLMKREGRWQIVCKTFTTR